MKRSEDNPMFLNSDQNSALHGNYFCCQPNVTIPNFIGNENTKETRHCSIEGFMYSYKNRVDNFWKVSKSIN